MSYEIEEVDVPRRGKEPPIPKANKRKERRGRLASLYSAAKEYKQAYKAVYGVLPELTWDGKWVRIKGQPQGVNAKRLKELTRQLKLRAG